MLGLCFLILPSFVEMVQEGCWPAFYDLFFHAAFCFFLIRCLPKAWAPERNIGEQQTLPQRVKTKNAHLASLKLLCPRCGQKLTDLELTRPCGLWAIQHIENRHMIILLKGLAQNLYQKVQLQNFLRLNYLQVWWANPKLHWMCVYHVYVLLWIELCPLKIHILKH